MWRPRSSIRAVAVGLVSRKDEFLLARVCDDSGETVGWRPLGGEIEFGEKAEAALRREFREEIACALGDVKLLAVIENLYVHHGAPGHEIVFLFEACFIDPASQETARYRYVDGGTEVVTEWVSVGRFTSGAEVLFPDGALPYLVQACERRLP